MVQGVQSTVIATDSGVILAVRQCEKATGLLSGRLSGHFTSRLPTLSLHPFVVFCSLACHVVLVHSHGEKDTGEHFKILKEKI